MNYQTTLLTSRQLNAFIDSWVLAAIKLYFFPYFLISISDNIADFYELQTLKSASETAIFNLSKSPK